LLRKSQSARSGVLLIIAVLMASTTVSLAGGPTSSTHRELELFGEVLQRVRSDYVEKPDDSKLTEAAINGMLSSLDPHSYYLDPKALREM
jgi:carboxyl-terminal processing protease